MSMKPLHIICGKCGSDEAYFKISDPVYYEGEGWENGVDLVCPNCAELTSPLCYNEWVEEESRKVLPPRSR